MIYEFQLVGGVEKLEKWYPMAEAPELGALIVHEGKSYRRIISGPPQVDVKVYDHVAINLPRFSEGAPHYDQHGHPAFQSKREVMEFARKNGMRWD